MDRYHLKVKLQKIPELLSNSPNFQIENDCHSEWVTLKTQDFLQCLIQILEFANHLEQENMKLRQTVSLRNHQLAK